MKQGDFIVEAQFVAPKAYYYNYFDAKKPDQLVFKGKFKGLKQKLVTND
jgi:hypothetical protein